MKKALMIAIGLLWTLASGSVPIRVEVSEAATISGLCLTETEFTDSTSMGPDESLIRQFLADPKRGGGFLKDPFLDVDGVTTVDAAQEIFKAAQANKINPKVLIATLEKEQGSAHAVKTRPDNDILTLLAGCGAPTTAKKQIACMGAQLRLDFDRLSQCRPTGPPTLPDPNRWQVDVVRLSGNAPGQETDAIGETIGVQPQSKTVAALYAYTPWVGLRLGGGHRSSPPVYPLVGGNGSFCRAWRQFGFERSPGPLALSPQNPTMSCAPDASRCLSVNVSGGTPGPDGYQWSITGPNLTTTEGVLTVTGVNKQNVQIKPPASSGEGIAYDWHNGAVHFFSLLNQCRSFPNDSCRVDFGCNDQVVGGTSPEGHSGPACANTDPPTCNQYCTKSSVNPAPCLANCGFSGASQADPTCLDYHNVAVNNVYEDHRTQGPTCRPCRLEMQGVTVTVTDAAGAEATTTMTAQ